PHHALPISEMHRQPVYHPGWVGGWGRSALSGRPSRAGRWESSPAEFANRERATIERHTRGPFAATLRSRPRAGPLSQILEVDSQPLFEVARAPSTRLP